MDLDEYKQTPVEKVMSTDFLSVQQDTSLEDLLKEFHALNDKSTAIAVYKDKDYLGLIEPLTLIKLLADIDQISDESILSARGVDFGYFPKTADDLVCRSSIMLSGSETVSEAATIMLKQGLTRLVVKKGGHIVGIVKASGLFDKLTAPS